MKKKGVMQWAAMGVAVTVLGSASFAVSAKNVTKLKLGYVEWDSCLAATNVAKVVLEKAGYKVDTVSVTGALMFQGLANKDLDAIVCAWLPNTHADYYEKTKDKIDNLGPNMDEADLGLAVPDYVDITTIPELKDHAKEFDNKIIGIDPGAGLMRLTNEVIKHYDLPETLVEGSDATMTAVLADAIRRKEPVVVTSWKPHWMWAAYDVRYLEDPDKVYGDPDHLDTLVRKGLDEDAPKAYAILKEFYFGGDDRGAVMAADREEGTKPEDNAAKWVADHSDTVQKWLDAGDAAE